jgi:hypothetical protein
MDCVKTADKKAPKTDFIIWRQWQKETEQTSFNEYPIMIVFVKRMKSSNDTKSLLEDMVKQQSLLRSTCMMFGLPRLVAAVTNFKYWHFH